MASKKASLVFAFASTATAAWIALLAIGLKLATRRSWGATRALQDGFGVQNGRTPQVP